MKKENNNMEELDNLKQLAEWASKLPNNNLNWNIERVEYFTKELFKYSKFKEGDIVRLKETPIITDKIAWGWSGYKTLLVKGAIAKIKEVDHYKGKFRYAILFQEEHGAFTFYEECLEIVKSFKKRENINVKVSS